MNAIQVANPAPKKGQGWSKIVLDVDTQQSNGYAFIGRFIDATAQTIEAKPGAIILVVKGKGSEKSGKALQVHNTGQLSVIASLPNWFSSDFASFRDTVASALNTAPPAPAVSAAPIIDDSLPETPEELEHQQQVTDPTMQQKLEALRKAVSTAKTPATRQYFQQQIDELLQ